MASAIELLMLAKFAALNIPTVQVDTTVITDITTGTVALTKAWPIPAGDATIGTTYRIKSRGTGGWPGVAAIPQLTVSGASTGLFPGGGTYSAAFLTSGHGYVWESELYITILSTGASGTARIGGWQSFLDVTAHTSGGIWTFDNAASLGTPVAFNTQAPTTMAFAWQWQAAPGGSGIICDQSIFYREGPSPV